jgi:hydrogenase maturation factor
LKLIAAENGIADAFDDRVVDAYWLGNSLLERVTMKGFYNHARGRLPLKERQWFELKLPQGAKPHHNYHVFNFIRRTGHQAVDHTVESMDNCRVSVGRLVAPGKVKTDKLIYRHGKLGFQPGVIKSIHNLDHDLKQGDLVSLHWGWVCSKINQQQAKNLTQYTRRDLTLANLTL